MPVETFEYDTAEHLRTPGDIALYIDAVLEDGDHALIASAIGVVARAQGMTQIAQQTGRSREQLYRTLSGRGNPQLNTLIDVLKAIGLRLSVKLREEVVVDNSIGVSFERVYQMPMNTVSAPRLRLDEIRAIECRNSAARYPRSTVSASDKLEAILV